MLTRKIRRDWFGMRVFSLLLLRRHSSHQDPPSAVSSVSNSSVYPIPLSPWIPVRLLAVAGTSSLDTKHSCPMFVKRALLSIYYCGFAVAFSPLSTTFISRTPTRATTPSALKMSDFTLDPSVTSFVFIEYQNEFTTPGGKLHDAVKPCMESNNMLENSKKTLKAARDAGCTIIHCPISFEPGHHEISKNPYGILKGVKDGEAFQSGSSGAEFHPDMKPQAGDLVVKGKSGLCGFESTNLDFLLSQHDTKNVVLGGFLTNCKYAALCFCSVLCDLAQLSIVVLTKAAWRVRCVRRMKKATKSTPSRIVSPPRRSKPMLRLWSTSK